MPAPAKLERHFKAESANLYIFIIINVKALTTYHIITETLALPEKGNVIEW